MRIRNGYVLIISILVLLLVCFCLLAVGCGESVTEDVTDTVENVENQASTAATEANLRTIDSAIQVYYATEGEYPSTMNDLIPGYLPKMPVDPGGGTYYIVVEGGVPKAAIK